MNRRKFILSFGSFVIVGIFVAVGIAAFERAPPDSPMRSVLDDLLFPGFIAGFVLGQRGENWLLGYFSCWLVNSTLYWLLWEVLFFAIRKGSRWMARP